MKSFYGNLILVVTLTFTLQDTWAQVSSTPSPSPQPVYQPQDPATNYVSHPTYPYVDNYGHAAGYEGLLIPASPQYTPSGDYGTSVVPAAQSALQISLRILAKVGLFLLGGVALLFVGGVFTTAVCSLTPLCTITFAGFGGINKDTMRSLVTPERLASAAVFVQDAVNKYERLQRST